MTLDPLLSAPLAIQIHVATVVPAAILGAYVLGARKGTPRHRVLGKIWLVLMVVSAWSSFFIHEIRLLGDFSPIHLLSAWVIFGSFQALQAARKGNIRAHRAHVSNMYLGGIVGAGLFTFLPNRTMNQMFFDGWDFTSAPNGMAIAPLVLLLALFLFAARVAWNAR